MGSVALILGFATVAVAQETQVITAEPAAPATTLPAEVTPQQPAQVVIIQEAPAAPAQAEQPVVTQPTTVVEDTPLVQSRAEQIRKTRQDAEVQTEQKIVEKLEESRLKDEQKRMKTLFGDKLDAKNDQAEQPQTTKIIVAPAPAPIAEESKEEIDREALKSEISESVKADLQAIKDEEKKKSEFRPRMVVGASLGTIDYEVGGIDSNLATGVSLGYEFRPRMELEGTFNYSEHNAFEYTGFNTFSVQDMEQYNFSLGVRYAVLPFFVSPVVGALASYTRRVYSVPGTGESEVESDALDAGFLVGVDILLGKNMSLAFDYRRMVNIENRVDNDVLDFTNNYNSFEDSDYDMVNLALRIMF